MSRGGARGLLPESDGPRFAASERRFELPGRRPSALDRIPDVRDGLTRVERVILWQLGELQKERGDRGVATAMLYGRVVEHVNISVDELQRVLARLTGGGGRLE